MTTPPADERELCARARLVHLLAFLQEPSCSREQAERVAAFTIGAVLRASMERGASLSTILADAVATAFQPPTPLPASPHPEGESRGRGRR
jgi:hypothetical protein